MWKIARVLRESQGQSWSVGVQNTLLNVCREEIRRRLRKLDRQVFFPSWPENATTYCEWRKICSGKCLRSSLAGGDDAGGAAGLGTAEIDLPSGARNVTVLCDGMNCQQVRRRRDLSLIWSRVGRNGMWQNGLALEKAIGLVLFSDCGYMRRGCSGAPLP